MSFASKIKEETPQTLWEKLKEFDSRILFTIPFNEEESKMSGFCSVTGDLEIEFPILTLCVEKPTGGCVVSTIVFPSSEEYSKFVEKIYIDCATKFLKEDVN